MATQRTELSALKRKLSEFEKTLNILPRAASAPKAPQEPIVSDEEGGRFHFRAAAMAANRKRLGLSAGDFGLVVGGERPVRPPCKAPMAS